MLKKILIISLLVLIATSTVHAAGIVEGLCEGNSCNLGKFFELLRNLINFMIMISIPVSAISAAYAGSILLFSGGNPSARGKAQDIFSNVVMGLVIMLAAWVLIYAITEPLVKPCFTLLKDPPSGCESNEDTTMSNAHEFLAFSSPRGF